MHILTFIRSSTDSSPDNKATAWPSAVILSTSHFAVFLVWQNIIAWPIVTTPYMFEIALNLASGVAQSTQYCPILSNDSSSFLSRITYNFDCAMNWYRNYRSIKLQLRTSIFNLNMSRPTTGSFMMFSAKFMTFMSYVAENNIIWH